MLISFKFSNILSFAEVSELNLNAGKYTKHSDHVARCFGGHKLLRMSSLYGANAAGKSNVVNALEQLRRIITKGTVDRSEIIPVIPFKFNEPNVPVCFDIEFITSNHVFKYVLKIKESVIIEEVLYILDKKEEEFNEVFIRKSNNLKTIELTLNDVDDNTEKERLREEIYKDDLRPNQTFLKEGANKYLRNITEAFTWFNKYLIIIGAFSRPYNICSFIEKEKNTAIFSQLFKTFESGISDIQVEKKPLEKYIGFINDNLKNNMIASINQTGFSNISNGKTDIEVIVENGKLYGKRLKTVHTGKDNKIATFSMDEESDGIRRLFDIMPFFYLLCQGDYTIVVDELERSIHPILLINLLEYFNSKSFENKGQLIFTTHESILLDLNYFRQDEIWFVEKDNHGCSHLYSLSDFKPRYDKDIRKSYLQGKFGAIPITGKPLFLEDDK